MVRGYVARVMRRYTPLVIGVVLFLIVLMVAPTKSNNSTNAFQSGSPSGQVGGDQAHQARRRRAAHPTQRLALSAEGRRQEA